MRGVLVDGAWMLLVDFVSDFYSLFLCNVIVLGKGYLIRSAAVAAIAPCDELIRLLASVLGYIRCCNLGFITLLYLKFESTV